MTPYELRIDRLWALLHAPSHVLKRSVWKRLLLHEAGRLREMTEEHFAREEEGGYLAELLGDRPHLAGQARALLDEHEVARARLEKLDALLAGEPTVEALRARLRDIVTLLSRHESRENELVQQATHDDLGGGD